MDHNASSVMCYMLPTSSAIPGGTDNGKPTFAGQPTFDAFALASLIGLSFSVSTLIMFHATLTSREQVEYFCKSLPLKLIFCLTSLFFVHCTFHFAQHISLCLRTSTRTFYSHFKGPLAFLSPFMQWCNFHFTLIYWEWLSRRCHNAPRDKGIINFKIFLLHLIYGGQLKLASLICPLLNHVRKTIYVFHILVGVNCLHFVYHPIYV